MRTLVAITRWARPFQEELAALAQLLGVGQYDLRMRLAGPIPVLVPHTFDEARARVLAKDLKARGHGVVVCSDAGVLDSEAMFCPREFVLESEALKGSSDRQVTLPYDNIVALIRATEVSSESSTSVTTKKKFSVGRAVATAGLVMRKKTSKVSRREDSERVQVLYVFSILDSYSMLLSETHLRYAGLGERMQASSPENFAILIDLLRQRAPAALYDDRLVANPRTSGSIQVAGTPKERTVTQSNASENDIAAHLLLLAHQERQL